MYWLLIYSNSLVGATRLLSEINVRRDDLLKLSDDRLKRLQDVLLLRQLEASVAIVSAVQANNAM